MPRRRNARPFLAIALVIAIAAAAVAVWHAAGGRFARPGAEPPADVTGVPPGAPVGCAIVDGAVLAQRLPDPVTAAGTAVAAGVPASAACELSIGGARLALARFDADSLRRLVPPLTPSAYFDSLVVGLEYEFKAEPESIAGLGARAVASGFDGDGDDPAQVVWQRGPVVFVLSARDRVPRERLLAVARALDATAP
jgi:hypothetical protein